MRNNRGCSVSLHPFINKVRFPADTTLSLFTHVIKATTDLRDSTFNVPIIQTHASRTDALLKFTGKNRGKKGERERPKPLKNYRNSSPLVQNYLSFRSNFEFVLDTFTMGRLDSSTRERSQRGGKVGQMGNKGGGSLRE